MIRTASQAIKAIEDTITNNFSDEIKAVYFEKFTDTRKGKVFPQLSFYYAQDGNQFGQNVNQVSFNFEFLDSVSARKNKEQYRKEIESDLFQVASRFKDYLTREKGFNFDPTTAVTMFDNRYKDGLGGVEFTLVINLPKPCLTN